jgi:CDP-glycerol glycerophosphotransferase
MKPGISIIIPTIGRPSLERTLRSAKDQLDGNDELIVVGDGCQPLGFDIAKSFGARYNQVGPTHMWGHAQRNMGITMAQSLYLAFMDDDDEYFPGALESIRQAIREHPGKIFLFRMDDAGRIIWTDKSLRFSNVSTQMFVIPNDIKKIGYWQKNAYTLDGKGGDFRFIADTTALYAPGDLIYRPEVIAKVHRHSGGVKT